MTRPDFTRSAFLRGGAAVAGGTIVSSVLAAVLTTILGVELGEEGYGTYAFVVATAGLLTAVSRLGVGAIVIRDIARSVSDDAPLGRREPIASALLVTLAGVVVLALVTVSPPGRSALEAMAGLTAGMVAALAIFFVSQATYSANSDALRGMHHQGWATLLALPTQRIVSVALVSFVVLNAATELTVASAIWLTAWAAVVAAVLSGVMLWYRSRPLQGGRTDRGRTVRMAREGIPIMVADLLRVVAVRLPIWVLAIVGAVDEAGVFALAAAFVALIRLSNRTMVSTVTPFVASSIHKGETSSLQRRLRVVAAGTFTIAAVAGVAMIVGGVILVPRVFGSNFGESVPVSAVLVAGMLFNTYVGPCATLLIVSGNEVWMTRATAISLAVGAVVMVPAAMLWGAAGAAIASAGIAIGRSSLQLRYTRARTGVNPTADFGALIRSVTQGRATS